MQHYMELNAHCIGASHTAEGLGCEDFSAAYSDEAVSVAAVSDGHGDQNCFRSGEGARLACEIGVDRCVNFQKQTRHIKDVTSTAFEEAVAALKKEIADTWRERVLSEVKRSPFTAEELARVSPDRQAVYRRGEQRERAYGCTLIIAMITEDYFLSLQIGDGQCVAAYDNGVFAEPVPWDENCVGNRATSLCDTRAAALFRHYVSTVKPQAVFVFSDGVEESFDRGGLYNCLYSAAYWAQEEGRETAMNKLVGLLPQISRGGSGDDVSLSAIVSTEGSIAAPKQPLEQIYRNVDACANYIEQCAAKTDGMKSQLAIRQGKCRELEAEMAALQQALSAREAEYKTLTKECDELNDDMADLAKKSEQAQLQMEKLKQYKQSAETFWFTELDKLNIIRNA